MCKNEMTKRELIIDSVENLAKVKIKLERERDSKNGDTTEVEAKLESVNKLFRDLVRVLDINFSY